MRGEYSLSDIAAVSGNEGFGGNNAWWLIVLIVLFGYGRNGYGFGGNGSDGGIMSNYVLNSDFATLQRQLSDGFSDLKQTGSRLGDGICNLGYTQAQLINGVDKTILTSANGITSQIADVGFGIKDCCCQQLRAIDGVNFNNAQNTTAITNAINTGLQSVMTNCNNNFRQLHDEIVANRIEDKNAQIQAQASEISALRLAASQNAQTCDIKAYVQEQVNPRPYPAYVVPNPYCNCNNGCGCGM